ncbi:MAG TPA: hypothetical protein VF391_05010, partial [Dermatophilaceae bacterium]
MTSQGEVQVKHPEEDRRPSRSEVSVSASRRQRHRFWVRRAGVVLVVVLLWLAWSIGGALAAPGTDSTSARLAEWARFNGLGWVVNNLEQAQYKLDPPQIGGKL